MRLAKHDVIGLFFLFIATSMLFGQKYTAMTYNIRMETKQDGPDQWQNRKDALVKNIQKISPDFLGIQEGLLQQMQFMDAELEQYDFIGVGRDDGATSGEYSALFYDASQWSVVETNTFWLSETPGKVSMGWDAACNRVCTHGLFTNNRGDTIGVFNTHLDHQGKVARRESVKLLLASIQPYAKYYPILLMGDFNFVPDDPNYALILDQLKDSRTYASQIRESHVGTFNGFKLDGDFSRRIDYIFSNMDGLKIKRYQVPDWRIHSRHVSDHFPVIVEFKLKR